MTPPPVQARDSLLIKGDAIIGRCQDYCVMLNGTRETFFWTRERDAMLTYPSRKVVWDNVVGWDLEILKLAFRK